MRSLRLPFLLVTLAVTACSGSVAPPGSSGSLPAGVTLDRASVARAAPSPDALTGAVAANNAFAFDLYSQVAPTANGGNLLTSPVSASLALTMTYAGAQGQTATEMASVLHLPSGSAAFDGQNALTQALDGRAAAALMNDQQTAKNSDGPAPSPDDYAFQVVNSIWGQSGYPWATPFLDIMATSYGTGIYLEDFRTQPTPAMQAINGWVSSATADKIQNLLLPGSVDTTTRLVLVNAVHLKLPWNSPFPPSQTASGPFTRGDGTPVTASFMHQGVMTQYVETDRAQVVSLPLAGNQVSVVFALPKNGLPDLVSSLTLDAWTAMTKWGFAEVNLSLPKFTFTSKSFSLATAVKALGMKTAFDPGAADFKGLAVAPPDGNLYIADVVQKATMAVAEQGVEAAAATAVLVDTALAIETPATMTLNHPFLVAIVDTSGAVLFLGQIDDPTDAGGP
jgi:serpin B